MALSTASFASIQRIQSVVSCRLLLSSFASRPASAVCAHRSTRRLLNVGCTTAAFRLACHSEMSCINSGLVRNLSTKVSPSTVPPPIQSSRIKHSKHEVPVFESQSQSTAEPQFSSKEKTDGSTTSLSSSSSVPVAPVSGTTIVANYKGESQVAGAKSSAWFPSDDIELEKLSVDAFGEGTVSIRGQIFHGSVLLTPSTVLLWRPQRVEDVSIESLRLLEVLYPRPELLLLGTGNVTRQLSRDVLDWLRNLGIGVEPMDSFNAGATFSMLNQENRNVICALLPYSVVQSDASYLAASRLRHQPAAGERISLSDDHNEPDEPEALSGSGRYAGRPDLDPDGPKWGNDEVEKNTKQLIRNLRKKADEAAKGNR